MKSSIIGRAFIVFGGKIAIQYYFDKDKNEGGLSFLELKEDFNVGDKISKDTETSGERVIMHFPELQSLEIVRDALDGLEMCFKGIYPEQDKEEK